MDSLVSKPQNSNYKDIIGIVIFIASVFVGTLFINSFVFRSFNVVGPSMESTLYTGDRLIVNRLPITWATLRLKTYLPHRGEVIVFKNPHFSASIGEEYIVKRVIAFPGERVVVKDGVLTVFNNENPEGFQPDKSFPSTVGAPTSGSVDTVVSEGAIFVSGDHRQNSFSYDSRNGLGQIPFYDIVGPVSARIYPLNKIRLF